MLRVEPPGDTQHRKEKDDAFENKYQITSVIPQSNAICQVHYEDQRAITLLSKTGLCLVPLLVRQSCPKCTSWHTVALGTIIDNHQQSFRRAGESSGELVGVKCRLRRPCELYDALALVIATHVH